jgi:hypothetical protein
MSAAECEHLWNTVKRLYEDWKVSRDDPNMIIDLREAYTAYMTCIQEQRALAGRPILFRDLPSPHLDEIGIQHGGKRTAKRSIKRTRKTMNARKARKARKTMNARKARKTMNARKTRKTRKARK